MNARFVVVKEAYDARVLCEELDLSGLGPHHIAVEAETSLITAGVEVAIFAGRLPGLSRSGLFAGYPWRSGHAMVGRVVAAGARVGVVEEGDRVLCLGRHASLQVYDATMFRPASVVLPIAEDTAPEVAVAARIVRVALLAMRASAVRGGEVVAVFGLGLVGSVTAQALAMGGARVIGLTTSALRGRLAQAVGIEVIVAGSRGEQRARLEELTGGRGVSVAVDAVGAPSVFDQCARVCRPGGRVLLLGTARAADGTDLAHALALVQQRQLEVSGAYEWSEGFPILPHRGTPSLWWDYYKALQLVRDGRIRVAPLLTDVIQPDAVPGMYRTLLEGWRDHLGVVVDWRSGRGAGARA
jgi:2-desacetyl-2-hydroxyethyl bacteriochlorophyllide A dehydrogenase